MNEQLVTKIRTPMDILAENRAKSLAQKSEGETSPLELSQSEPVIYRYLIVYQYTGTLYLSRTDELVYGNVVASLTQPISDIGELRRIVFHLINTSQQQYKPAVPDTIIILNILPLPIGGKA